MIIADANRIPILKNRKKVKRNEDVYIDLSAVAKGFAVDLVAQYLESKNLLDSVDFANKAAALSVMKKGASASMPTMEEVVNFNQIP